MDAGSSRVHATVAMIVTGLGLGLLIQNLSLAVQNGVPSRHLGAATSAAQFFRTIGGTIGVSVMGSILASGMPAHGAAAPAQLAERDPSRVRDRRRADGGHARDRARHPRAAAAPDRARGAGVKRQHYGLTLLVLAVAGLSFALLQTMVRRPCPRSSASTASRRPSSPG